MVEMTTVVDGWRDRSPEKHEAAQGDLRESARHRQPETLAEVEQNSRVVVADRTRQQMAPWRKATAATI